MEEVAARDEGNSRDRVGCQPTLPLRCARSRPFVECTDDKKHTNERIAKDPYPLQPSMRIIATWSSRYTPMAPSHDAEY